MASNNIPIKPVSIAALDHNGQFTDSFASFYLAMAIRNNQLMVIPEVDGQTYWQIRGNASDPDSRSYRAIAERVAWDFLRRRNTDDFVPALVVASECGMTPKGYVATNSVIKILNQESGRLMTFAVGPYEFAGSREVSYADVNGRMRKDLTEALPVGQIVMVKPNPGAGILVYRGLTSALARNERRGPITPHSLGYIALDEVKSLDGVELFNTVHYLSEPGDTAMPATPKFPEVRFDIFRDVDAETKGQLWALMSMEEGAEAPASASSVEHAHVDELDAILAG